MQPLGFYEDRSMLALVNWNVIFREWDRPRRPLGGITRM